MKEEFVFTTNSPDETENLGKNVAKAPSPNTVIAFKGDLGAGKTCFVRGLAQGLGFFGETNSPTFSIVNEYIGGRLPLYHFDMYRIESWSDLYSIGFFDYLENGGVLAIEWSENIENALPEDAAEISITNESDNIRKITIRGLCVEDFSS